MRALLTSLFSGVAGGLLGLSIVGWIARRRMKRIMRAMAAAAARRPCARACGREALDGHLTCGDVACDERGARDELAASSRADTAKIRRPS